MFPKFGFDPSSNPFKRNHSPSHSNHSTLWPNMRITGQQNSHALNSQDLARAISFDISHSQPSHPFTHGRHQADERQFPQLNRTFATAFADKIFPINPPRPNTKSPFKSSFEQYNQLKQSEGVLLYITQKFIEEAKKKYFEQTYLNTSLPLQSNTPPHPLFSWVSQVETNQAKQKLQERVIKEMLRRKQQEKKEEEFKRVASSYTKSDVSHNVNFYTDSEYASTSADRQLKYDSEPKFTKTVTDTNKKNPEESDFLQKYRNSCKAYKMKILDEIRAQSNQLPTTGSYTLEPSLQQLLNCIAGQLKQVSNVRIKNSFGQILFTEPINMYRKVIDECVQIEQDLIKINDEDWLDVPYQLIFYDFGSYREIKDRQEKKQLLIKIKKWVSKKKMELVSFDRRNGNLHVKTLGISE